MSKLLHFGCWHGARQGICRFLVLALFAGWQAAARADSVTLTSPSTANLQYFLSNGHGNPWVIYLNFTSPLVTTNPLVVGYSNTMLIGATSSNVVISGNNASQVFTVPSNVVFIAENLTISAGNSLGANGTNGSNGSSGGNTGSNGGNGSKGGNGLGGGIYNQGNTSLINCALLTNSATGGGGGAGGNGGDGSFQAGAGGNGGNGGNGFGGAVYNLGTLLLSNCTVAGNSAVGGNGGAGGVNGAGGPNYPGNGGVGAVGAGAGIYNVTNAILRITNCTFNNNSCRGGNSQTAGPPKADADGGTGPNGAAAQGGGIYNLGNNSLVNCTFYQNLASGGNGGGGGNSAGWGAGIGGNGGNAYGAGLYNASPGVSGLTNCTLANNGVFGGTNGLNGTGAYTNGNGSMGAGFGANIANVGGSFILRNSILAYPNNAGNSYTNGAVITDQNNNISSDATPKFTQSNSTNKLDPQLLALAANGGPVETMALQSGSPAITTVTDANAPGFDARGVTRGANGTDLCIGAYEFVSTNGNANFDISGQILPTASLYSDVTITVANTNFSLAIQPDANGNFALTNLFAGTYTVTPQPTNGITFSPASAQVTVPPGTNGQVFNANFAVSGQITNVTAAVAITLTDDAGTNVYSLLTDSHGNYATNLPASSYTISPQATNGISFSSDLSVTVPPNATNENFTAYYAVGGQITNVNAAVAITITNNAGTNVYSLLSGANGVYATNLPAGSYTIIPQPANGINFTPTNLPVVTLPPIIANANFTGHTTNRPNVAGLHTVNHAVVFSVSGVSNLNYFIQASTNLAKPTNWVTISTNNSGTNGTFNFTNSMTNFPRRFFRAVAP